MINARIASVFRSRVLLYAGAAAVLGVTTTTGARLIQIEQGAHNRTVEISASYRSFPSVASLTRTADTVIVGNVIAQSPTRFVAQPKPSVHPFTPSQNGKVDANKPGGSVPASSGTVPQPTRNIAPPPSDQPVTDYTIEVTRVMKGSSLAPGARITVTQAGGTVQLPTFPGGPQLSRTFITEHDQLMTAGEQHLFFLGRTTDGRYFSVGGPQGRFAVDKAGKVHPVDPSAPAARTRVGVQLEALASEIQQAAH